MRRIPASQMTGVESGAREASARQGKTAVPGDDAPPEVVLFAKSS